MPLWRWSLAQVRWRVSMTVKAVIDERTLHETYLRAFEIAVKQGEPDTVMCAYNRLNGAYCSENGTLLTDILRRRWGFRGLVVSDWGAVHAGAHPPAPFWAALAACRAGSGSVRRQSAACTAGLNTFAWRYRKTTYKKHRRGAKRPGRFK